MQFRIDSSLVAPLEEFHAPEHGLPFRFLVPLITMVAILESVR
nr:MAG TPA: hypothetical protein [Caudoviricetes sp.]